MKSDKRQTMVLIGIALIAVAGVLLYVSLSQPRVYENDSAVAYTQQAAQSQTTEATYDYPINLNTATLDELMSIDGLGEARALAILEYRDYLGEYSDVSEIMNIKGISEAVYAEVAPYLTV